MCGSSRTRYAGAVFLAVSLLLVLDLGVPVMAQPFDPRCGLPADFDPDLVPAAYRQPEMMAIGDSLYNGVTSLSIDRYRAARSVPALVADAFHLALSRPAYPRPMLFDMDAALSSPALLARSLADAAANLHRWNLDPDVAKTIGAGDELSGGDAHQIPAMFDNIAVASMAIDDLLQRTPATAESELDVLRKNDPGNPEAIHFGNVADWYFALNTRFLLNPRASHDFAKLAPLGQVIARNPKRLLINIGSNDGVWLMAFDGLLPTDKDPDDPKKTIQDHIDNFLDKVELLADCIPPGVQHVYFNSLPLPSITANLLPLTFEKDPEHPPYYRQYTNWFSVSAMRIVSGSDVAAMDTAVRAANARAKSILEQRLGARVVYVDLGVVMAQYDYKHFPDAQHMLVIGCPQKNPTDRFIASYQITNLFAQFIDPPDWHLCPQELTSASTGGMMGLDGMHPTLFGYALVARAVADAMKRTENLSGDPGKFLDPQKLHELYRHEVLETGSSFASATLHAWHDINTRSIVTITDDSAPAKPFEALRVMSNGLFRGPSGLVKRAQ